MKNIKEIISEENRPKADEAEASWKVLTISEDQQFHRLIQQILSEFSFEQKGITSLSAYSTKEALKHVHENKDVAIVLIDVSLEADLSLKFIKYLREEFKNNFFRIILFLPESYTIEKNMLFTYDIDDCIEKSTLKPKYLVSAMTMALRSFSNLKTIESGKTELRAIASAANRFIPHKFLKLLQKESIADIALSDHVEKEVTVLFLDIRG